MHNRPLARRWPVVKCQQSQLQVEVLRSDRAERRRATPRDPLQVRKASLASTLAKAGAGIRFNGHMECDDGEIVFRHACKMGLQKVSCHKRRDFTYRSGRSSDWLKMKNPACAAVRREAEEDWGR